MKRRKRDISFGSENIIARAASPCGPSLVCDGFFALGQELGFDAVGALEPPPGVDHTVEEFALEIGAGVVSVLEGGFRFLVVFAALVREDDLAGSEAVIEGVELRGVLPFLGTGTGGVFCVVAVDLGSGSG
jgi:hypothetical protein